MFCRSGAAQYSHCDLLIAFLVFLSYKVEIMNDLKCFSSFFNFFSHEFINGMGKFFSFLNLELKSGN